MAILGLDVGTTAAKALAVDEAGRVLGRGRVEYILQTPRSGWVEQDAEQWWLAAVRAARDALAGIPGGDVTAVCLSAQGATMLAVDEAGTPLCPAITWMDRRAEREAEELIAAVGGEALYRKSGWPPGPTLDAAKIAWLRRNSPEIFEKASSFVSTLEFMNFRLTGRNAIDPTNAAIRQLMDIQTGRWDAEILSFLDLEERRLPELLPSGALLGTLTKAAAQALGLPEAVRVYNGAHDQYCAAVGSGVRDPGDMLLATGTTWVVLGVTERLLYTQSRLAPGIFPLTGRYAAMASMVSAGSALKWWKNVVGADYADLDEQAADRMESARSLLFYPYVAGAGALHEPGKAAAVTGMTLRHDRYDLARALMEGVAFEARLLLGEFAKHGSRTKRLTMTGGAAGSRLWSEITGYVTGCEIVRPAEREAACLGAVMLAAVGEGVFPSLAACAAAMARGVPLGLPDRGQAAFYEEKFQRYCDAAGIPVS